MQSLMWKSRFVRRIQEQLAIKEKKEQGFYDGMTSVDEAAAGFDDREPYILSLIHISEPTRQ